MTALCTKTMAPGRLQERQRSTDETQVIGQRLHKLSAVEKPGAFKENEQADETLVGIGNDGIEDGADDSSKGGVRVKDSEEVSEQRMTLRSVREFFQEPVEAKGGNLDGDEAEEEGNDEDDACGNCGTTTSARMCRIHRAETVERECNNCKDYCLKHGKDRSADVEHRRKRREMSENFKNSDENIKCSNCGTSKTGYGSSTGKWAWTRHDVEPLYTALLSEGKETEEEAWTTSASEEQFVEENSLRSYVGFFR